MGKHAVARVGHRHVGGRLAENPRPSRVETAIHIRGRIQADDRVVLRTPRAERQVRSRVAVTSRAPVVSAFRRKEWPGIPFLWALVYVALFAIVFFKIPFSLGDTYSHLAGPALSSWRDAFVDAFTA